MNSTRIGSFRRACAAAVAFLCFAAHPLLSACKNDEETKSRAAADAQSIYYKDLLWKTNLIPACWIDLSRADSIRWGNSASFRAVVEDVIVREFAKTPLRVQFQGQCQGVGRAVRIYVGPYSTVLDQTGRPRYGLAHIGPNALRADRGLQIADFLQGSVCAINAAEWRNCVQNTALHEFGHIAGLAHEHARAACSGNPGEYAAKDQFGNDVLGNDRVGYVGGYDPTSIMNYCYVATRTNVMQARFSAGDLATLSTIYSRFGVPSAATHAGSGAAQGRTQDASAEIALEAVSQSAIKINSLDTRSMGNPAQESCAMRSGTVVEGVILRRERGHLVFRPSASLPTACPERVRTAGAVYLYEAHWLRREQNTYARQESSVPSTQSPSSSGIFSDPNAQIPEAWRRSER